MMDTMIKQDSQKIKYAELIKIMQKWVEDESGYDEIVGPIVEKDLKENPVLLRGIENE